MICRISFASLLSVMLLASPFFVHAAMSEKANAMCNPWIPKCGCNRVPGPKGTCVSGKNTYKCPPGVCYDTPPGGKVNGICVAKGKCEGSDFTNQQGEQKGVGDAKGFGDALKQVMGMLQQLMQQKGAGGGGQGQSTQGQLPEQGCKQYYQVTTPSTDPCAYYVPPTSDSLLQSSGISGSDALVDALNEGSSLNVSDTLLGALGSPAAETTSQEETSGSEVASGTTSAPAAGSGLAGQQVNLQSGTRGDIVVSEGGATIVAQARDAGANTEVAGFYGSGAAGGQSQGVISNMCKNRPWAGSVVSFVIPPVFFDSLCAWRGYQVGAPPPPPSRPAVERQTTSSSTTTAGGTGPQPQAPAVEPRVEIWAVPAKVPLGTRTSVFWNASGVASCSITSPDGSFNESTLSGGAATVPLSGATTFTISCLTAGGSPVTDYVTVQLAI